MPDPSTLAPPPASPTPASPAVGPRPAHHPSPWTLKRVVALGLYWAIKAVIGALGVGGAVLALYLVYEGLGLIVRANAHMLRTDPCPTPKLHSDYVIIALFSDLVLMLGSISLVLLSAAHIQNAWRRLKRAARVSS